MYELHHELGADPTGWTNGEVTHAGSAGMVHGPFGNDVRDVTINIPIPAGLSSCEVRWRSWAVESLTSSEPVSLRMKV